MSHTDAWVKVGDGIQVRLNLFLDDVVRYQTAGQPLPQTVSPSDLRRMIAGQSETLLTQLQIFDSDGRRLTGIVTKEPTWEDQQGDADLVSDATLKLSWNMEFSLAGEVSRLFVLQSFTDSNLQAPGELRFHLSHQKTGRRIDSVIPPGIIQQIRLPSSVASGTSADPNLAVATIAVGPGGIIHEFTAPLTQLTAAWSDHRQVFEQLQAASTETDSLKLPEATADAAVQQLQSWFLKNLRMLVNEQVVEPDRVTVTFLPSDLSAAAEGRPDGDSNEPAQLVSRIGVQSTYRIRNSVRRLRVEYLANPGQLADLQFDFVSAQQRTSELLPADGSASGTSPVFVLNWQRDAASSGLPDFQGSGIGMVPSSATDPVRLLVRRPTIIGVTLSILICALTVSVVVRRRASLGGPLRIFILVTGFLAALGFSQLPDVRPIADSAAVSETCEYLLNSVYQNVAMLVDDNSVDRLHRLLHEDLVEQTYLSILESLAQAQSSDTDPGGLVVSVGPVTILNAGVDESSVRADQLDCEITWQVSGNVHHWGHTHVRTLQLNGSVTLYRDSAGSEAADGAQERPVWKIRSLRFRDSRLLPADADGSPSKSTFDDQGRVSA
ncbi:MAG: hypothetical protein R3C49_07110 [Planctomycetaceae bacterium]